ARGAWSGGVAALPATRHLFVRIGRVLRDTVLSHGVLASVVLVAVVAAVRVLASPVLAAASAVGVARLIPAVVRGRGRPAIAWLLAIGRRHARSSPSGAPVAGSSASVSLGVGSAARVSPGGRASSPPSAPIVPDPAPRTIRRSRGNRSATSRSAPWPIGR